MVVIKKSKRSNFSSALNNSKRLLGTYWRLFIYAFFVYIFTGYILPIFKHGNFSPGISGMCSLTYGILIGSLFFPSIQRSYSKESFISLSISVIILAVIAMAYLLWLIIFNNQPQNKFLSIASVVYGQCIGFGFRLFLSRKRLSK